ncbi:DUF1266 domain-containing protein [Pseudobutyrivibrio sp. MD2005]|uniref:DUF1266 domain-containing protein n=1 Tax=Pseudobutyrivibrio sp. MD2005 TaxID=1410616 RepID=UPI00047F7A7C|nr:DUF1266 domain-containing protein [Pseudobutyrivibrio sp. MD2005]
MKKRFTRLTALALAGLMLVGCGGGKDAASKEKESTKEEAKVEIPLVDESFKDATESDVSNDLIRWLLAANAVEIEGQGLDWQRIGGARPDTVDLDTVEDYLSLHSAKSKDKAIEKVEELVKAEYDDSSERAYNLGTAEGILAASYCSNDMDFDEYLMHAVPVSKMIQQDFESFDDYGDNYVAGYMTHVGEGEFGDIASIGYREVAQQEFVGLARFYDEAYAIDFDMELTKEAYSTFFDDMPKKADVDAIKSKDPEFVLAYIAPKELGDNPKSGNIEIDGDVYHMPFTIKQFMDNGWKVKDAPDELATNREDDVTLKRKGKTITVTTSALRAQYTQVEYGLVEEINTVKMGSVDVVLPGDIKEGKSFDKVVKTLKKYGITNGVKDDGVKASITSAAHNMSDVTITEDDGKVGSFSIFATLVGREGNLENYYEILTEDEEFYNYSHAMSLRAKTYKYRPEAEGAAESDVEMSDNLDDFTLQIDGRVVALPLSYQQLVDMGFEFEDGADTVVPAGEEFEFSGYYLGNEYSKMNFGVVNYSEEDMALSDLDVQYVRATMFGWNQYEDYPFIISQGAELEIYNLEDLEEMYGPLEKSGDTYDNGYVTLDYYEYKSDAGWYIFWIQPEGMLSGIEVNKYMK